MAKDQINNEEDLRDDVVVEDSEVEVNEDADLDEETLAAKSLHPKAAPGEPMGKVAAMAAAMTAISGMSKEDLNKFAATMAQFGPGKDWGVGDKSAANQSTIDTKLGSGPKTKDAMPKLGIKEDLDEMFNGYEPQVGQLYAGMDLAKFY